MELPFGELKYHVRLLTARTLRVLALLCHTHFYIPVSPYVWASGHL